MERPNQTGRNISGSRYEILSITDMGIATTFNLLSCLKFRLPHKKKMLEKTAIFLFLIWRWILQNCIVKQQIWIQHPQIIPKTLFNHF